MSFFALTWRDFKLFTKLARPHRGRILGESLPHNQTLCSTRIEMFFGCLGARSPVLMSICGCFVCGTRSVKSEKWSLLAKGDHKGQADFFFPVGLGCLFVSTSAFLAVPRILGQFIDASTAEHHEGEEGRVNFLKRLEHVASENMWTVLALLVVGASAFAARVYLLSTAGIGFIIK